MPNPPDRAPGFGPPQLPYRLSVSDPEPLPTAAAAPAPPDLGPAPRRSRTGLLLQFTGQFLYIPLWVLLLLALVALLIWSDSSGDVPGGEGLFSVGSTAISWRRFRAEWTARPADWEPIALRALRRACAAAESSAEGKPASQVPPSGVRRAAAEVPVRYYRGLGAGALAESAERLGWSVDWEKSRKPYSALHLFRLLPPPAPPAARTGPGWEPLPARLLVPLLTLPLRPRVRTLELRRSADAYRTHVSARLDARFRAELARDPRRGYCAEDGAILRRVLLTAPHYRGIGAAQALRLAEERGWGLDPTYRAEPGKRLRLCRPDRVGSSEGRAVHGAGAGRGPGAASAAGNRAAGADGPAVP